MAESLIKENQKYVGKDLTEKAVEKIKGKTEEGGKSDEQKTKKRTRRVSNAEWFKNK